MSQTTFRRADHQRDFFSLKTQCLRTINLSWKAKGIHSYLLSLGDHWELNLTDLENRSTDGRDSLYSGIKELVEKGFFLRKEKPKVDGKFQGVEYVVFEESVCVDRCEFHPSDPTYKQKTQVTDNQPAYGKTVNGLTVNGKPETSNNTYSTTTSFREKIETTTELKEEIELILGAQIAVPSSENRIKCHKLYELFAKSDNFTEQWKYLSRGLSIGNVTADGVLFDFCMKGNWFDVREGKINVLRTWIMKAIEIETNASRKPQRNGHISKQNGRIKSSSRNLSKYAKYYSRPAS